MRELWVIVDMFYVLIRMVVAQAYPFIKITRTPKISSVQSLNCVRLFATPWTTAHQASLSNTFSQSLPKLMSIKSVMPSISSFVAPFSSSFSASGSFAISQFFTSGGQSIGVSASASVLPMHIQDWFPLGWTGWISLPFKGLSRVFSNTTFQKHQFFGIQLSLWSNWHPCMTTGNTIALMRQTFVCKVMSLPLICCLVWS